MKDITGQKFGRLTAIRPIGKNSSQTVVWMVNCDCGTKRQVPSCALRSGHTKSCGCLQKDKASIQAHKLIKSNTTHGLGKSHFYNAWAHIKERCYDTKSTQYEHYGGRGIRCDWARFEEFKEDMYESYLSHIAVHSEKNTTIDRRDVNGNYNKKNCRWATRQEQSRNRRNNHVITFAGRTHCVAEWAEITKINVKTIYNRLYVGWSPEKALTTPVNGR